MEQDTVTNADAQSDGPRFMLHMDGQQFEGLEPDIALLNALSYPNRMTYRNDNAAHIATAEASKLLIVAGPGTGKTTLFISRIKHWLTLHEEQIHVTTFVRKLVRDLEGDLDLLPKPSRKAVDASTLHTLARSLVERGHGTTAHPMGAFVRVIDQFWADVVWDDVLAFHPEGPLAGKSTKDFEFQFHLDELNPVGDWPVVTATYRSLCRFYNAAGFAYFIVFARETLQEKPGLSKHKLWIIDEYQDFNPAEDHLIDALTSDAIGVVLAGDDEQALYQTLKQASPEIIMGYYADQSFAKAMLPYCSRCGFHICQAASAFIAKHRDPSAIDKIYLPLYAPDEALPVTVVAAPSPSSAVDYIRKFLEDNAADFDKYLARRKTGKETDPFLLVLSTTGGLTLNKASKEDAELQALVDSHGSDADTRSAAYLRVSTYAAAALYPGDNFAVRKSLHFESLTIEKVHAMIAAAMEQHSPLSRFVSQDYPDIAARVARVGELVEVAASDPDGAAQELITLLRLRDARDLASELAEFPFDKHAREKEDEEAIETAGALPPVALMTMNGAKGLSAHHVIIVGCDDVNMGYTTPLTFFVALTRARRSLHVVASRKTGGSKNPHPFVLDLPSDSCRFVTYKKTGRAEVALPNQAALTQAFRQWEKGEKFGREQAAKKKKR
jgi:superfamily I DNA/RNA helicase